MKDNIHFFSQNETAKKVCDMEKLGQRGRQAMEFADLALPILPGLPNLLPCLEQRLSCK